jgi:hypothetical protein
MLKPDEQRKLLSTLGKNGRLINKDVDILIAATIQPKPVPPPSVVASAPAAAPAADDDLTAGDEDTRPWYDQTLDLVKKIQAIAPPSETDIAEICEDLLKFVEYAAAQAAQPAP